MERIPLKTAVPIVGSFIQFTHIRNSGVAFGLLGNRGIPFVFVSLAAMMLVVISLRRVPKDAHSIRYALAAILGGAAGNLVDRVRFQEVIDFIDIGIGGLRWPVFNVADIAVTAGVLLFIVGSLLGRREPEEATSDEAGAAVGPT